MPRVAKIFEVEGDKAQSYENQASFWLAEGNLQQEKGNLLLAEKYYNKAQYWLDLANKVRGWN